MTGRGVDQILPHPSEPRIHEPYTTSAVEYVRLAERANGPIPRSAEFAYVWGDALSEIESRAPDVRVGNLETAITTSDEAEPKGINYRMHPRNVPCLQAAGFGCCVLANNHVLDWGRPGLLETLESLRSAGISTAGAGRDGDEAARPAVIAAGTDARVLVFGFSERTSGVPPGWAAGAHRPGVRLLPDLSERTADRIAEDMRVHRRPGDLVVASIHWGGNWGYEIPASQRAFAHRLVEAGTVDVVHGHSSHHPKAIECYLGRPILYGCGDFVNDYEGIGGYERFRADLVLAYFVTLDDAGSLVRLVMVPFRTVRFRLERPPRSDVEWIRQRMDRECSALGSHVGESADGALELGVCSDSHVIARRGV